MLCLGLELKALSNDTSIRFLAIYVIALSEFLNISKKLYRCSSLVFFLKIKTRHS